MFQEYTTASVYSGSLVIFHCSLTSLHDVFKEQINKLKDENAEVVELLQKQLDVSEMDNIRLQREIQQLQRLSRMREESVEHTSPSEFYPITAHPVEERQEGEVNLFSYLYSYFFFKSSVPFCLS